MKLEVAPYNLAKLAKEKGFNTVQTQFYLEGKLVSDHFIKNKRFGEEGEIVEAPTLEILRKFVRTTRGVHIEIDRNASGWYWYMCKSEGGTNLGESGRTGPNMGGVWDTYDEALIDALFIQLHTRLARFEHWGNYASVAMDSFIANYNRKTYEEIFNNSNTKEE